jgi:hypothetical protein
MYVERNFGIILGALKAAFIVSLRDLFVLSVKYFTALLLSVTKHLVSHPFVLHLSLNVTIADISEGLSLNLCTSGVISL